MGVNDADAVLRAGIDTKDAEEAANRFVNALEDVVRAAKNVEKQDARTEKSTNKLATGLKSLKGAYAAIATAAVVAGTIKASKALIEQGTRVEETASKYRTTLGPAVREADAFISSYAEKIGLTTTEARDLIATNAAVAQGLGYTQAESANVAEAMVRLAGDMASFNNLPTEQVLAAIRSGLVGEREALKTLGIVITEEMVKERALIETGKANASQLTQQEKAAANLALMYEKAGVAVGDVDRTFHSTANTLKRVGARVREAGEILGEEFLPIFAGLIGAADKGTMGMDKFRDAVDFVTDGIHVAVAIVQEAGVHFANLFMKAEAVLKIISGDLKGGTELWRDSTTATKEALEEIEEKLVAAVGDQVELANAAQEEVDARKTAVDLAKAAAEAEERRLEAFEKSLAKAKELEAYQRLNLQTSMELIPALVAQRKQLEAVAANESLASEERIKAAEEVLALEAAIASAMGASAGALTPVRGGVRGLGTDLLTVTRTVQEGQEAYARAMATTMDEVLEAADPLLQGLASLSGAFGILNDDASQALRGISDVASGLQALRGGDFSSIGGLASSIGGIGAIAGGIAGLVGGLFGGNEEARRLEEARNALIEENNRRLQTLAESLDPRGFTVSQFQGLAGGVKLDTKGRLNIDFLRDLNLTLADLERMARDLGITIRDETGKFIPEAIRQLADAAAYAAEALEREEAAYNENLKVRRLAAEGLDAEADALRQAIENQKELDDARAAGYTEATLRALEEVQALEAAARAAALLKQEAEAAEEAARKVAEFSKAIEVRQLYLQGLDDEARTLELRIRQEQELADAIAAGLPEELIAQLKELQAGEFQSFVDELARLAKEAEDAELARLAEELAKAAEEAARAAEEEARAKREAAEAAAALVEQHHRLTRAMEDDLDVRELAAAGMDAEARLRQLEIQQRMELEEALEQQLDASLIDRLRAVQAAEYEALRAQVFESDVTAATAATATRGAAMSNRGSTTATLSEATGQRMSAILLSQLAYLRYLPIIAANTARTGGGGSVDAFLGDAVGDRLQFAGRVAL